ncbi:acyl-coenzyme A thioesterase THEM4 isoform X2 [Ambystoma mexicanum]|uniref:acyl-coenzyme A thioesterase THEM4 isoform X2 n=1 Tax=Ambystoma mexicanum TaxID=8296 RepID=UPI0037E7B98D
MDSNTQLDRTPDPLLVHLSKQLEATETNSSFQDPRKDFSLPNSSWKKEMLDLYNKFMELTKDGTWKSLPSYNVTVLHLPDFEPSSPRSTRLFTRNLDVEGAGMEYAMFMNLEDKRVICLFQPGPYVEGAPGFTHGGCIATILDAVSGMSAIYTAGKVMTANLNINYRNPLPLGSVVVVESYVEKIEGRKIFISCQARSADDTILYSEATALFIRLNWTEGEKTSP